MRAHSSSSTTSLDDSDGDGWLDSTEFFSKRNPNNYSDKPSKIIVDGIGNDWFEIIPQKLQRNQFVNDQCPASADITYYAAVYGNESIVIFGSALESEVEEDGRESYWFVDISLNPP